jgi:hypothetical protein
MLQASFSFTAFLKTEGKELKRRILQKVLRKFVFKALFN